MALVWLDLDWDVGNQTGFDRRVLGSLRPACGVWDARESKFGKSSCRVFLGWGGRVFDSVVAQLDSWPDLLSVPDPIIKVVLAFLVVCLRLVLGCCPRLVVVGVVGGFVWRQLSGHKRFIKWATHVTRPTTSGMDGLLTVSESDEGDKPHTVRR